MVNAAAPTYTPPNFSMSDLINTPTKKNFLSILPFFSCLETGDNICRFFLKGHCSKGNNCQFRHVRTDPSKAVVCKHWLRGLCKKGDNCEFLHEYNLRKMPECWFYSKYGECNNGTECIVSLSMASLFFFCLVLLAFRFQSCDFGRGKVSLKMYLLIFPGQLKL